MHVYLVHHGDAVPPDVDPGRPLSAGGREATERVAREAARRGAKPIVIWHSGKLRARQTAEIFWRACNPFAEFSAARNLQPDDPPAWMHDRLRGESRDVLVAGHFPHIAALLRSLDPAADAFPLHGCVALETKDDGVTWIERWRVSV